LLLECNVADSISRLADAN